MDADADEKTRSKTDSSIVYSGEGRYSQWFHENLLAGLVVIPSARSIALLIVLCKGEIGGVWRLRIYHIMRWREKMNSSNLFL